MSDKRLRRRLYAKRYARGAPFGGTKVYALHLPTYAPTPIRSGGSQKRGASGRPRLERRSADDAESLSADRDLRAVRSCGDAKLDRQLDDLPHQRPSLPGREELRLRQCLARRQ